MFLHILNIDSKISNDKINIFWVTCDLIIKNFTMSLFKVLTYWNMKKSILYLNFTIGVLLKGQWYENGIF